MQTTNFCSAVAVRHPCDILLTTPRFSTVLKETGVDPLNHFMVVGLRGSNLVGVHDAKSLDLQFDHNKLNIVQVTRDQVSRVSNALYDQFVRWGIVDEEATRTYSGAMHSALNRGPNSRLLFVTGKVRGLHDVKVASGRDSVTFSVAVVPRQSFTVAFKYLQHLDDSGNMKAFTPWNPSDGRWLINKLNWIYGPQTNVSFSMASSDWIKVNQILGEPLGYTGFLNSVAGGRDKSADLNVFLVGKWKGGEAGGSYFSEVKSAAVEGTSTLPVTEGSDPFLVNLAHEVAHFLTYEQDLTTFHHDRPGILLSSGIQSTQLDKDLVLKVNSPW